jgi:translocator protein
MRDFLYMLGFVALPLILGGVGGVVTAKAIPGWYRELRKPSWNPPNWIFGPVWSLLYLMMGVASWLVWKSVGFAGNWVWFYGVQLLLNAVWSWVFFGLKRLDLALINIALLWVAIVGCLVVFWQISVLAGALLVPYLLWVSFASVLNFRIWALNRD